MKVEVNRNDEMPKVGDLVIDELGNIGILMHNGYIWLLKHLTVKAGMWTLRMTA